MKKTAVIPVDLYMICLVNKLILVILTCCIFGCRNEDIFTPELKYVYSPEWKVWEIKLLDPGHPGGNNITRTRDIESRYIFTDTYVYHSSDQGNTFDKFLSKHISIDSISFLRNDIEIPRIESYFIRNIYIMSDAFPPTDSLRKVRDGLFPEIEGKLLFLQLENKQKITVRNKQMTEYLLLYN